MPRILILSSWVAHGHVGLCAAVPALQALGLSAMQVPMCVLSNHPGWPHVAGRPLPVDQAEAMLQALRANGWLAGCDAVLTGYMGKSSAFEDALADFSVAYADQNERDYDALVAAVRSGTIEAHVE